MRGYFRALADQHDPAEDAIELAEEFTQDGLSCLMPKPALMECGSSSYRLFVLDIALTSRGDGRICDSHAAELGQIPMI
jgi:hypothetical protein